MGKEMHELSVELCEDGTSCHCAATNASQAIHMQKSSMIARWKMRVRVQKYSRRRRVVGVASAAVDIVRR